MKKDSRAVAVKAGELTAEESRLIEKLRSNPLLAERLKNQLSSDRTQKAHRASTAEE